ncbi:lysozyme inhibitor LprI family protein [Devosia lacusdianchii]|uniref:lysozyme inhibitor LprI family protein n=1 Tax=Devosia lacusdianchii TaxID=2917991 RepID=UPI001F064A8C|nr:lysozyme inhibitor LprI family protein [Devosia sp. JXJ CY 41]
MKIAAIILSLALLAMPAWAVDDYAAFELPAEDVVTSSDYTDCLDASGGVHPTMMDCIGAEYGRLDLKLADAYAEALERVSHPDALKQEQAGWLEMRAEICEAASAEAGGGQASDLVFADCELGELIRRTRWLDQLQPWPR